MPEKIDKCPVCNSKKYETYLEFPDLGGFLMCECGAAYLNERMTDEEQHEYYKSGAYRAKTGEKISDERELSMQQKRAGIVTRMISPFKIRSHLDIGCSSGELIKSVAEGKGKSFRSAGVDLDPTWTGGVANLYSTIDEVRGKYDLITMIHILEHLNKPKEMLRKVKDRLSPGGVLLIEVPNRRAYLAAYAIPNHVVAYDLVSLGKLVVNSGFSIIAHSLHGWLFDVPLDLYISIFATNDKELCSERYTDSNQGN